MSDMPLPRPIKSATSSYMSDATAIKEFYTAVSLVNDQDIQKRIHQAMDTILNVWTKRHEEMINAMSALEDAYATLQHESRTESTLYHKCMRDLQFYKAKYDLISDTSSSMSFDRRSYLSMDSCGRSTVATSVSNTTSKSMYSRKPSSGHVGYASLDSFYYPTPAEESQDDSFDITSVFEHCYPTHIPSAKPPPADDLPLPPPPPSPKPVEPAKSEPEGGPKIQGAEMQTPPAPLLLESTTEELKFACGDGFWHTIAKGKSNKEDVDTLIKNYLKRGGRPNVANNSGTIKSVKEGYGLIHALVAIRNTSALRRILEAGANPNVFPLGTDDKDKISPLVLAASLGYMNGVRLLVERARVNVLTSKDGKQKNALMAAIEADALDVVMYLLRICRKLLDQVDDAGATPLHYASMAGKTRMITFLVKECGQICDAVDYKGETPLHYALRYRHPRAAAKLVDDLGADPNVIKKVATPLDLAKSGGLRPIMAMVRTINNNLK